MGADRPRFDISHLKFEVWNFGFGIFLALAFLFLWPLTLHPNFVPFTPHAQYSDLLITHLPNAEYLRDSLARYGQWPLWNAQILAGQPFAADPLAGMWYPPNLLLLVLPLPFGFNLLFALHFAWAGYGLFLFLRDEGLSVGPALLGSVAFMGAPKWVAHLGAGHVSLVFAVAWTPWLLLAVKRVADPLQGEAMPGGFRRGALAGACLALLFLADVRWAFYAAALGAAFWLRCLLHWRASANHAAHKFPAGYPLGQSNDAAHQFPSGYPLSQSNRAVHWFPSVYPLGRRPFVDAILAFAVFFFSLSAILTFPLAGFVLHSNRSALTLADAATYSLPPRYLLGLLIPDLGGFHEWMTYLGVFPLVLALVGVVRRLYFWITAVVIAAAFSLGTNFLLFPALYYLLPGLRFLRVPPRAWFIVALGVAILAAHGAQLLTDRILPYLVQRYSQPSQSSGRPVTLSPSLLRFALPALMLFTLADLLRVDATLLEARPRPDPVPAAKWIAAQPGLFRVYSPSYSLPLGDGLQHVDGVNPLQLAAPLKFIEAAIGVEARGYSVTVPAFDSGDPGADISTVNANAIPDAQRLGQLNVKYVAAEFPIHAPDLALVQTFGQTRVYENAEFKPRAWMNNGNQAVVLRWLPDQIAVQADGPGTLVLGEVMYPGWEVRVDGVLAPLETVEGVLRSVSLGEGRHQVVFEFRPRAVAFGAVLSVAGLAALALIWRWERLRGNTSG